MLWPAGLLASLALLLPILLHRLPRRQSTLRRFAALRYIGQHAAPRQRPRLAEWPLLCLRLLLLAVLTLWLAAPRWLDWPGLGLHWRLIWPGVSTSSLATLPSADRSLWLVPGLPAEPRAAAITDARQSASLLRELATRLPPADRISVVVPEVLEGLDDEVLRLAREVDWVVVAAEVPNAQRQMPLLAIRGAAPGPWLAAALDAWQADARLAVRLDRGGPEQPVPAEAESLLWIGDAAAPRWAGAPGPWLQIPHGPDAAPTGQPSELFGLHWYPLAQRGARLASPLSPQATPAVLDADFPRRLHGLIFQRETGPGRAPASAAAPQADPARRDPAPLDLQELLALLAGLLFIAERWLSSGRRLARSTG
nr:BatA domain-containing protein [Lysobacter sp. CAU 1642]